MRTEVMRGTVRLRDRVMAGGVESRSTPGANPNPHCKRTLAKRIRMVGESDLQKVTIRVQHRMYNGVCE
jgi:hypothetical protein